MNTSGCCHVTSQEPAPGTSRFQRIRRITNWIVPGVVLAAMPKCPACVAAYVAILTGCGISLTTAGIARWLIIATCVVVLVYFSIKTLRDATLGPN